MVEPRILALALADSGLGNLPNLNIRDDTAHMLSLAAAFVQPAMDLGASIRNHRLDAFMAAYRDWILVERGMVGDREAWAERHSILLHLMVSGSTLGEAMAILTRFAEPVWGASTRFTLVDEGKTVALVMEEPQKQGPEGLVSALWLLSSMICQLEFLVGHRLEGVSGHVHHPRTIAVGIEKLLFGHALEYLSPISAVRIPKADTQRAVTANTTLIPSFLSSYMRLTVNAERPQDFGRIVADILWRDLNRGDGCVSDMPATARSLGMSASTLRRQLEAEGSTFKAIRAMVVDRLVKTWLIETNQSVEEIAERVGYSDAFALRRAFVRMNGRSPRSYRKTGSVD